MVFGIQNIGSTCYLNSALQIIHSCPHIKQKISHATTDDEFICALRDVNVPKIIQLLGIKFNIGTPHDVYEVFLEIIDRIEKSNCTVDVYGQSETTIINRDGSKSLIKDTFSSLIFPDGLSIDDLTRNEYVPNDDATFIYKQTTFTKFPSVLVCIFPNTKSIDIPDTFQNRKLNCLICLTRGHYFSIVYDNDTKTKFIIDDDKIYQVNGECKSLPVYMAVYSDG